MPLLLSWLTGLKICKSEETMRVLIVVRKLNMGGLQTQTLTLARAFSMAGHDASIAVLKPSLGELEPEDGIKKYALNLRNTILKSPKGLLSYALAHAKSIIMGKGSADIASSHAYTAAFLRKLADIEDSDGKFDLIIVRGQGAFSLLNDLRGNRFAFFIDGKPFEHKGWFAKTLNKSAYFGHMFVCVSDALKSELENICKRAGIDCAAATFQNLIDSERVRKMAEEHVPALPERYIVSVGRLIKSKCVSQIISAMSLIPKDTKLVVVGDGPFRDVLEREAEARAVADRVIFVGEQSNPYPYIKNARLLAHASVREGFGMVFLEALCLGVPVVAMDAEGGMKEIMQGQILSGAITPRDPSAFAKKINEVLARPYKVDESMWKKFDASAGAERLIKLLGADEPLE